MSGSRVVTSAKNSHTKIWPKFYKVAWNKELCPSHALLRDKVETSIVKKHTSFDLLIPLLRI